MFEDFKFYKSYKKVYKKKITNFQKKYLAKLSLFALLLISSTILANERRLNEYRSEPITITQVRGVQAQALPSGLPRVPVLKDEVDYPLLSAQSVIVLDMDSMIPLYEKNPNARFLPASTTKIMTAIVALEHYDLEDELIVERFSIPGQKMNLLPGERITVENLLYGLLIHSANDAAEVLSRNYPGGRSAFIKQMNIKADELSLQNTSLKNPSGLDDHEHYSTSKDLVTVAAYAMKKPFFAKVVSTERKLVTDTSGNIRHYLRNINELLGSVEGVLGVKTGWTENARENLVTYIERDDRRIMVAVMGSQDRFGETRLLIDWIFDNYNWVDLQNYSP